MIINFEEERDKLIENILSSNLYCQYCEIDRSLYEDENLIRLNNQKEELLSKIDSDPNNEIILSRLNDIQKSIFSLPCVKEYFRLREIIKILIKPINEQILEKIF